MNARRTPLIVGILLAIGTAFLVFNFLLHSHSSSGIGIQRSVVIAVRDIPARARIMPEMVGMAMRNVTDMDPDVVLGVNNAVGRVSLITILSGSTVTQSKIATPSGLSLPMQLHHGLRAVSIGIDRVKGVSGLIQPGDRVDVIAVPSRVGSELPEARTILRAILVLALGNETETASATPSPDNQNLTTVTLAVNPDQANLLAEADLSTTLRLALRSPDEESGSYPAQALNSLPVVSPPITAAPVSVPDISLRSVLPQTADLGVPAVSAPRIPVIEGDRTIGASP